MSGTETGLDAGDGMATTAAGGGAVLAARQVVGGTRVDGLFVHDDLQ